MERSDGSFQHGFTKHDWAGAALFAVSIAVGLTPEMLPMIVTTCLAKGAMTLSGKKVIVKDLNCRRLCVIASYNTGAGNVSRAFIGSTRLNNAYDEINKLDYNQLYRHLTRKLSTAEARSYVKGVTKKREKYIK